MTRSVSGPREAVVELSRLRAELESIDQQLIDLIVRRTLLAREAGDAKRVAGLPLMDPVREVRVIETAAAQARQAGIADAEVWQIFRLLVTLARKAQDAVGS
ncbi:MAG: chorismate mutase [Gemmatimonadota bacterium]